MDLGPSIEVTLMNKMPLFKNHGLESAFILQQEKTSKSLNVYIPIILHEFHDAIGILTNPNKLKEIFEPLTISNEYVLQN